MNFRMMKAFAAAGLLCTTLASCTTNPATGRSEFTPFMSPAQERQIGLQQHPELLKQFGGAYDDVQTSAYVATIGGRMAKNSELADLDFTFTVLNSKVINAFALPGGYVYISRGLLGLMNDEAELASVLGHEVGHVTARHAANRYNKSIFAGIVGAGIGIATGSSAAAELFTQGSQAWLLSYSRNQEFESDKLGVRYMTRAGYDAYGSARMLNSLGRQTALDQRILGREEASRTPAWARTHPLTEDRVRRALQNAEQASPAGGQAVRRRDALLAAIDGMLYDDDPEQGVIRGHEFWHGKQGFMFAVPDGFALQNSETSVLASGPNGAAILFASQAIPGNNNMRTYVQQVWNNLKGQNPATLQNIELTEINGMKAAHGNVRLNTNSGPLDLRVVGFQFNAQVGYHFIFVTSGKDTASWSRPFEATARSFRKLSKEEAENVFARRIKVVTVQQGDTSASLAGYMAYEDYKLERFLVLNGLREQDALRPGQKAKLVVYSKN